MAVSSSDGSTPLVFGGGGGGGTEEPPFTSSRTQRPLKRCWSISSWEGGGEPPDAPVGWVLVWLVISDKQKRELKELCMGLVAT